MKNDRANDFAKVSFSLVGPIIKPLDHDKANSSARIAGFTHSAMDKFTPFIIANMTLIYFRDLVDISTLFASQISLLLGLEIGYGCLVEGLLNLLVAEGSDSRCCKQNKRR